MRAELTLRPHLQVKSAEVTLQQALESLAVAGLVASHLVNGVVDGIQVELLGLLR